MAGWRVCSSCKIIQTDSGTNPAAGVLDPGGYGLNRTAFTTALAILLVIAMAGLAWQFATVLLLAFAGLLFAVLLRHLAQLLARYLPLPVGACLVVVLLGVIAVTVLFSIVAGTRVASQVTEVVESLPGALKDLRSFIGGTTWGGYFLSFLSNQKNDTQWNIVGMLGGTATTAATLAANLVIVFTVAIFLSVDPGLYRRGVLHLVPKDGRSRAEEVLDTLGGGLWRWLLGQSIDMVAVALMTGLGLWLIGVPVPMALGLIAGLTNFIPYLGPFLSGIPAALIAFSQSPADALYTAGLFLLVQQIEGNILMPTIQKRATSLPPVLTILAVVALGGLFGLLGALLATPLMLVAIILVRMLYVEDVLGDTVKEGP
jgi:predicted PurR-regulated permease PerM